MFSRWPVRRNVIVNLKDGDALRGVLLRKRGPILELANVELHYAGNRGVVPVDGTVVVEREHVSFMQVLVVTRPAAVAMTKGEV